MRVGDDSFVNFDPVAGAYERGVIFAVHNAGCASGGTRTELRPSGKLACDQSPAGDRAMNPRTHP